MNLRVVDIAQEVRNDVDVEAKFDVKQLDATIFTCLRASTDALNSRAPVGYSNFERDFLVNFIQGLRSSHTSIRKLLADGHDSSSVDALVIARLQLESLYNFCFLLGDSAHLRLYLKNGWKKQYVRFLLGREESKNLPRASQFYLNTGPMALEQLRGPSFVSEAEKHWIEYEELGLNYSPPPSKAVIEPFPTPGKVLRRLSGENLPMLKRLYPEYQHLCSFAHGANEATFFRTVGDDRSPVRHAFEPWKAFDIGQRQVAEPAVLMSALSCVCVATELFAVYQENIELAAKTAQAWDFLVSISLLAGSIYLLRAKRVLGVI